MQILVHTRSICDFCVDGRITLDTGPVIKCYHCEGAGYYERWDDLRALFKLVHHEEHSPEVKSGA